MSMADRDGFIWKDGIKSNCRFIFVLNNANATNLMSKNLISILSALRLRSKFESTSAASLKGSTSVI